MIHSMTGFGSASATDSGITVSVEVRSLNSRFLDSRLRLPKQLEGVEDQMKSRRASGVGLQWLYRWNLPTVP